MNRGLQVLDQLPQVVALGELYVFFAKIKFQFYERGKVNQFLAQGLQFFGKTAP